MSDTRGIRQAVYRAACGPGQGATRPFAAHSVALLARREAWRERLENDIASPPPPPPNQIKPCELRQEEGCFRQAATCDCTLEAQRSPPKA